MRPLYETSEDRKNELRVARSFAAKGHMYVVKLPLQYRADFAITDTRGRVRAWCEVKCRTNAHDKYPTYMLSLAKWMEAERLSDSSGLPFYLIVSFKDGTYFLRVRKYPNPQIEMGGRTDRGDAQDVEPTIHLPMTLFRSLASVQQSWPAETEDSHE